MPSREESGREDGERQEEAKEGEEAGEGGDQPPEIRASRSVLSSLQSSMQSIAWRIEARLHQVSAGEREGGFGKADEAALRSCSPMRLIG
jgi:hypothetical protein